MCISTKGSEIWEKVVVKTVSTIITKKTTYSCVLTKGYVEDTRKHYTKKTMIGVGNIIGCRYKMEDDCCKNCLFFHKGNGLITRCRRYPPHPSGYFSPTTPENWCGEYKR
jgi:hypothetical protein